ncbi:FAD/NAD-P-binding domain-containing protein [Mycena vulgaris]|nr:FAD/NAD-P-binding domain-containing protein [Mycena vulgaris]
MRKMYVPGPALIHTTGKLIPSVLVIRRPTDHIPRAIDLHPPRVNDFLHFTIPHPPASIMDSVPNPLKLTIVIVGCGLGGLAAALCFGQAGHQVTVYEAASEAAEIGAGIQVPPNVSRLLRELGLQQELERVAVKPRAASWRRYDTGMLIGTLDASTIEKQYGVPHYNVHVRYYLPLLPIAEKELHRIMYNATAGIATIETGCRVTTVKAPALDKCEEANNLQLRPSIILSDGRMIFADLVVGADGVKSVTRDTVCNDKVTGLPTNSAYRAIVPTHEMVQDPQLKVLVEEAHVTCWMGPGRNIVGYCISGGAGYNLVFSCPSSSNDLGSESWSVPADVDMIRNDYVGWEPSIQKLIDLVSSTSKWKLVDRPVLNEWVHKSGIVLIGDACHPLLPYGGQGAAMAIPRMLDGYMEIRKARCARIGEISRQNGKMFHLPDGPEQVARDYSLSKIGDSDKHNHQEQFMYDVHAEVQRWFETNPLQ